MSEEARDGTALDVSALPTVVFSHRTMMWWGTLGLMAVEGTVFALAVMTYFYLRSHADNWPLGVKAPDLLWGTVNTIVMLVSLVPNHFAKKAAERFDLAGVRLWLWASIAVGVLFLGVRVLEFASLNVRWDTNAYGSIVWLLMGLHTTHLVTDVFDSIVLGVLFFTGPLEGKRYTDVSENAFYWYFVVFSWLPIYLVLYWGARAVSGRRHMPTFFGLLIAPSIALGAQSLMFALVTPQCSTQTRVALHAVAVLAFLLTAGSALLARRDWRLHAMPPDAATQGPGETRRFLAASATAVAALSALLVLVMWFAAWVLSPCLP